MDDDKKRKQRGGALLVAVALALTGCGRAGPERQTLIAADAAVPSSAAGVAPEPPPMPEVAAPEAEMAVRAKEGSAAAAPDAAVRRHVAQRHNLQILTSAKGVEAAWKAAQEACAAARCEMLAASLARHDDRWPMQASLEARVPHDRLEAFLSQVAGLGTVGRHDKTAQDRTDQVIDTEARLKSMREVRDSLRRMMAAPGARLKDLIDVERELARVQAEIDSLASRRKALADETEMAHVMLAFSERPAVLETGVWAPVHDAWVDAGHVFARSVAGVISFVVAALPVAFVLAVVAMAARAVRRRRNAARHQP